MGHTKGEWKVDGFGDRVVDENSDTIATMMKMNRNEAEANAHLIAAAPALYEALKNLRHTVDKLIREGTIPLDHPEIVEIAMQSNEALWAITKALSKAEEK